MNGLIHGCCVSFAFLSQDLRDEMQGLYSCGSCYVSEISYFKKRNRREEDKRDGKWIILVSSSYYCWQKTGVL